jgi:diguanylate cyclase (GGDEF)-like protein
MTVLSHAALITQEAEEHPHVIVLQTDITARKQLEAELERRAMHDDLTDLSNRGALAQYLELLLRHPSRCPLAALFIDLDNFKTVNDQHGHAAGDAVLVRVAEELRRNIRAADLAARVGGDEFVVICEVETADHAEPVAERIRHAIERCLADTPGSIAVTASVGVTLVYPDDTPDTLIRRADTAAYIAKRAGRARCEVLGTTS